jgi:tetratricopeptide (TPR) repeat protein
MLQQQHDKALEQLLKAEKINPKDFVILNNIGEAYKRKDDKRNAIKYFKLTSKYGNEDAKNSAQEQIDKLKKN